MSASLVFILLFLSIAAVEPTTVNLLVVTRNYSVKRLYIYIYIYNIIKSQLSSNTCYSVRSLTIRTNKEIAPHLSLPESSTAQLVVQLHRSTWHTCSSLLTGLIQTHTSQMRHISTLLMWYNVHSTSVTSLTGFLLIRTNVSSGVTRDKIISILEEISHDYNFKYFICVLTNIILSYFL